MESMKVGPTIAEDIKAASFWAVLGDPVSAATTNRGRLIYGAAIGLIVYLIRTFGFCLISCHTLTDFSLLPPSSAVRFPITDGLEASCIYY